MSSSATSKLGLIKPGPGTGEAVNLTQHINQSWDKIDDAVGAKEVTSSTRPTSPWNGQLIWESDTGRLMKYTSSTGKWDQVNATPLMQDGATGSPLGTAATTEAVLRTLDSKTYKSGKAYDIEVRGQLNSSAANAITLRLRKGTLTTGTLLLDYGRIAVPTASVDQYLLWRGTFGVTGGSDVTTQLVLCGITTTGTCVLKGFSTGPFDCRITELPNPASTYEALPVLS